MKKIKLQSLIKLNGYYMQISGRTGNRFTLRNYVQLCLNGKWVDYIHKLEKYQDKGVIDDLITDERNVDCIMFYAKNIVWEYLHYVRIW